MAKYVVMVPTITGSGVGTAETKQGDVLELETTKHVEHLVQLGWLKEEPKQKAEPKAAKK